jgi:predicted dehydrogenase
MNEIKVGVIGSGYWGPNLIRNFVEIPESEVVAVADLRDERLQHIKKRYPKINVTKNYQDLLKMGLDAVVVATPPSSHHAISREFLKGKMHVLVEKPITLNSQHAEELVEIADQNGLTLMTGHTFEYNPAVLRLKEIIDSGELGELIYTDSARLNLGLFQPDLNVLWDLAPHDISILLFILGRSPISATAIGKSSVIEGIHDVVYLNLTFPDNIMAHIHLSWLDPCKVRRVTVVGTKKMVVYNDIESLEKIKIYDKGVEKPAYTNTFDEFQLNYRYGDILIPNINFKEPLRIECQHFLDSIKNHTRPRSCGRSGLRVIKVLEAIQHALENGGEHEIVLD